MRGGGGDDTFVYVYLTDTGKTAPTRDIIQDFAQGADKIDLALSDANWGGAGNGTFVLQTTAGAAFSGAAGSLRYVFEDLAGTASDKTIIEGDINGDLVADLQIELNGLTALVESDFYL